MSFDHVAASVLRRTPASIGLAVLTLLSACGLWSSKTPARAPAPVVTAARPAAPAAAPARAPAPAAPATAPAPVAPATTSPIGPAATSSTAASPVAAAPVAPAASAAPPPPPPPPILPFDEAVLSAANNLLGKAQLPANGATRFPVVIDPLIDGMTGGQSVATQAMGDRLVALIRERYSQQYEVLPFNTLSVAKSPLVLIGTFTGVNKERKTEGQREAYRICFALADMKSGKLVSKGLAFARPDGVDPTPTAHFRDAPAWAEDPATLGYIRTCQGTRAGDPIHPMYIDRILAASMISEAMDAYAAGKYTDALALYETVARAPAGHQMRTFTGLYLTNWRLGRHEAATRAFGQVVDQGLESKRLGVKFLFRPGSIAFWNDPRTSLPYPMWLDELSAKASKRQACMEVVGHTSRTGPEPVNERLSLLRAEYVKGQIERIQPTLSNRMIANGVGSRENLIGNGRDDGSDALDRRVEFKVVGC
jgi:outer membrane protein OmpA-like peptidoglycan-associated protein